MGEEKQPPVVKLFFGLLFSDEEILERMEKRIINDYGDIDGKSPIILFDKTTYYVKELGEGILRGFLSIQRLIDMELLPSIKTQTNTLEKLFAHPDGRRRINIDPGYLSLSKVVLATTKDYDHRLYLGKNIYGEVTLHYRGNEKSYQPWEWTYPDYREKSTLDFFNQIREIYKRQIRGKNEIS
ncbi:DUF4416 family protein [Candidatus Sumerlaeota bacterium]|nr:DUF4416 family protein [Candidatus Sumerlaeota bacterium]